MHHKVKLQNCTQRPLRHLKPLYQRALSQKRRQNCDYALPAVLAVRNHVSG